MNGSRHAGQPKVRTKSEGGGCLNGQPPSCLGKEAIITSNKKYEITDITHEKYPFLHRIRALRDIGREGKAGDLGGFVESESNLSAEAGDDAWIFGDAIAAGEGYVDESSVLRDRAIVCGHAYVSKGAEMSGDSRAEDDAYIRGARLSRCARASGNSMILQSTDTQVSPILTGSCVVYGKVIGDIMLAGTVVVISGEEIINDSLDTLSIDERGRTILRDPSRDELVPHRPQEQQRKPRHQGRDR